MATEARVGPQLRDWRKRRRLTQLELALDAGISTRHLSFVETGRSKPGREMVLRISDELDIPFRERNQLLLAAGHAPAFPARPLDDPELAPVREALDLILEGHAPYPAVVLDRGWNLVTANSSMWALTQFMDIDPALLEPPINALRVGFHPRGLAPLMVDLGRWRAYFLERLARQVATTGDQGLAALLEEVVAYPAPDSQPNPDPNDVLGPLKVRGPDGGEVSFLGMFATFDSPFEVTTSELAIELLFPADQTTREALQGLDSRGSAQAS